MLSVVIIAINEKEQIAQCLESLKWCDEVVVVIDDRTTDRTEEIAHQYTDKVFIQKWLGYGAQKNFAVEKASGDWILSIDADEQVSPELAKEVQAVLKNPQRNGYNMPFHTFIGSKRLRFGGFQNEHHLRLFKKSSGGFGGKYKGVAHETVEIKDVGYLHHPVIHYTYKDTRDFLAKVKKYSFLEAQTFLETEANLTLADKIRPGLRFLNIYFRKFGFLDGWPGFVNALYLSYYVWNKNRLIKNGKKTRDNLEIEHNGSLN